MNETKKHILFIINPISGTKKKNKVSQLIAKELDHARFSYEITYTKYRGHAVKIAENAAINAVYCVVVVGGDGSVSEVAGALIDTSTALAILPAGSGNGMARHLEIPLTFKTAIHLLNNASPSLIDTMELNHRTAIGVAGFGFDAWIAKKFDTYKARGIWSYTKLVIKEFRKYKGIEIAVNGKKYSNLFFCSVANMSEFGNGFSISPESNLTDTKIELVLIKKPTFWGIVNLAIASYFKTIHQSKYVETLSLPYFQLGLTHTLGHIDGDPVVFDVNSIDCKVVPKSLWVISGKDQ